MTRARDLANLGSNPPLSASLGGPGPHSLGTVTAKASFEDVGSLLIASSGYTNANPGDATTLYLNPAGGGFPQAFLDYFQKNSGTIQFKAGTTVYTFNVTGQPYGASSSYLFLSGSWTGPVYSGNLDIYAATVGQDVTISNPDGVTVPADLSKVYINGTAYEDIYDANNTTIRFRGSGAYSVGQSVSIYGSDDFLNGYDRDGNLARTLRFNSDTGEFATPSGPLAEARSAIKISDQWTFTKAANATTTTSSELTVIRPNPSRTGRVVIYASGSSVNTGSALSNYSSTARLQWKATGSSIWRDGPSLGSSSSMTSAIITRGDVAAPYVWFMNDTPQGNLDFRIALLASSNVPLVQGTFQNLYLLEL